MNISQLLRFSNALLISSLLFWPVLGQDKPTAQGKKKKPLALETTRKFEFATTEGTWMSVDISPDGSKIIFDLLGDIYTIPAEGGKAAVLSGGIAFESQPKYSPDGGLIAFVSDRNGSNNLWIAKSDGTDLKQLSKEKQGEFAAPVWTEDGEYVVVSKSTPATRGSYELWMYHKLGGAGLKISKGGGPPPDPDRPPPPRASEMGAFPVKGKLYFAKMEPRTGPRFQLPDTQIIRRDTQTGDEDGITFLPGMAFRPVVSSDGKTLVFATRYDNSTGLRIRDTESGDERWLKFPVQRDELESRPTRGLLPGFSFTPDNRHIVISYGGKIRKISVADGSVTEVPFSADVSLDAGPPLYVQNQLPDGPVRARLVQEPDISNLGRIAFSALTAVYVLQPRESEPVRLTSVADPREYQPVWSPDGSRIAYVSWSTKGGHVWTATPGSEPERITDRAAFYRDPVFSPDMQNVVVLRTSRQIRVNHPSDFLGPQPGLDVVRISLGTRTSQVIVPSRGLGKPHFGPEKDRVYVYGNKGLVSYRLDGTDSRTHLRVVGKGRGPMPNPARDVRLSPDGKHALALFRNGQLYLAKVPQTGGTVTLNIATPAIPVRKVTGIGADSFSWTDEGKTLVWTVGSTIYRRRLSDISFEQKKSSGSSSDEDGENKEGEENDQDGKKPEDAKADAGEESKADVLEVTVEKPRHVPKGSAVLRNATVITMRGREVIDNADIVIIDNRIAGVGRRGTVPIPRGAKSFDLTGKVIIPGIIDIHAHWEVRHAVLDTEDYTFLGNLAYGVTSGRDPQTSTNDTFAYQDLVDTGQMLGPRIFNTGPGIFSDTDFSSYEEARDTVARYKKHYRAETLKSYLVGNRQQRQWVVMASKELGIIPTTEGGSDFALDLTHAIDGFSGNEHSLPVVPLYDDVVRLFAMSGITYTPTLVVSYGGPPAKYYFFERSDVYADKKLRRFNPRAVLDEKTARLPFYREDQYIFPQIAAGANAILKAGGRVGVGGHGELQGLQCHWEMWGMAMGGMENHDVLRTATILGAEAIGYGKELGSLESGKMADLVVLDRNPLADIRNTNSIRYVMKNGEMFDGDTLDQIYPLKKELPEMWWWSIDPEGSGK